jgi:hypothetical protein
MYIFLDVDGVLNTSADWRHRAYSLNKSCVDAFNKFLKTVDNPKIVLSSTWRNGIARDGSTAVHIDDLMRALNLKHIDKTAVSPDGSRSKEIDYYLRRHEKDSYVILDDDPSLFENREKTKGLYLVNPATGLTDGDVKKIITSKTNEGYNGKF